MRAGMIPLVSEWTGAKEVVSKVNQGLVLPVNKKIVAEKVIEILNLTLEDKVFFSRDCQTVSSYYTQEAANASFVSAVNDLLDKFRIHDHSKN